MQVVRSRKSQPDRPLAEQFGLVNPTHNLFAAEDGLSEIEVKADGPSSEYIPYTNRALNWHTDGYYRSHKNPVRAMLLHCVGQRRKADHLKP